MPRCLISLGANLGDPQQTIQAATRLLRQRLRVVESGVDSGGFELSRPFRTPPVGGPTGQPPFVNAVVAVETPLTLHQVWQTIRAVELELGRERDRRWEARQIDLDILLYERQRIWTPRLKVPHPRMCMRRFILIPAMDVAADWIDPVTGLSICELAKPLQSGAGSLCLVASNTNTAQAWLKEVSELAAAQLLPSGHPSSGLSPSDRPPSVSGSRWLSLVSTEEFERHLRAPSPAADEPRPKLTIFLAEPSSDANTAWENQHLHLAQQLQLMGSPPPNQDRSHCELPTWVGPRYLLPSHDGQWAIHEMVSALEAMDCPVEPIDW